MYIHVCHVHMYIQIYIQMIGHFHEMTEGSKGAVTTTRKLYEADYCDEIRLNENFKRFVANYRLAYEGPNTVSAQTGVKYSKGVSNTHVCELEWVQKSGQRQLSRLVGVT